MSGSDITRSFLVLSLAIAMQATAAQAEVPAPLNSGLFALPGGYEQPSSAASAGMALADEWLGDSPFSNPAAPRGHGVTISPTLLRMSRQDLRAGNRNYDERAAFFDGAGAALAIPATTIWLYVSQPVLRFEDFAFNRGSFQDPSVQPAVVTGRADMRETRAGVSASLRVVSRLRLGAGVEWSRRDDRYDTEETSGAPDQGTRHIDFSGEGVGGTLGLRYTTADSGAHMWTIGGALRYVPEIQLDGAQQSALLTDSSDIAISATREAGWEGGLAVGYAVTSALHLMLSMGGSADQRWKGFDMTAGSAVAVRVGGEYHDARDPWTLRFGIGQEQQKGVPEPRAGSIGLGLGYDWEGVLLDFGVLHRGIDRTGRPRSYDDRVVGSVTVEF